MILAHALLNYEWKLPEGVTERYPDRIYSSAVSSTSSLPFFVDVRAVRVWHMTLLISDHEADGPRTKRRHHDETTMSMN